MASSLCALDAAEVAFVGTQPRAEPVVRIERLAIKSDADLTTLFLTPGEPGAREIPVLSFLRDKLGYDGPDSGRLRDVWVLTYGAPSIWQRAGATMPFVPLRLGKRSDSRKPPKAFLDANSRYERAVHALIEAALRSTVIDPAGLPARATTLSYQGNLSDHRRLHLYEALTVLRQYAAEAQSQNSDLTLRPDLIRLDARLALSDRMFGDLVSDHRLPEFQARDHAQIQVTRGHNWELLRQKAEENGLYFQPVGSADSGAAEAILWIALDDLQESDALPKTFDGSLLGITNPWTDSRLATWTGYSEMWHFDPDGRQVPSASQNTTAVLMAPLALYSLDHPRTPFLLVDFRDGGRLKRTEFGRRIIEDVPPAVIGFALFANWEYRVASTAWSFIRGRHGSAVARSSRISAYAQARVHLLMDRTLSPTLEAELDKRLESLSLNPLRENKEKAADAARRQYEALVAYAKSERGLQARLDLDRRAEMAQFLHGKPVRALMATASIATLGAYRHREPSSPALLTQLAGHRRRESDSEFIRQALAASPRVEVVTNRAALQQAVDGLVDRSDAASSTVPAADRLERASLVAKLVLQTDDDSARRDYLSSLRRMDDRESIAELTRLSVNPALSETLRAVCAAYLSGSAPAVRSVAGASGTNSSGQF